MAVPLFLVLQILECLITALSKFEVITRKGNLNQETFKTGQGLISLLDKANIMLGSIILVVETAVYLICAACSAFYSTGLADSISMEGPFTSKKLACILRGMGFLIMTIYYFLRMWYLFKAGQEIANRGKVSLFTGVQDAFLLVSFFLLPKKPSGFGASFTNLIGIFSKRSILVNPIPVVEPFPMIDPIPMADSIPMRDSLPMLEFMCHSSIFIEQ